MATSTTPRSGAADPPSTLSDLRADSREFQPAAMRGEPMQLRPAHGGGPGGLRPANPTQFAAGLALVANHGPPTHELALPPVSTAAAMQMFAEDQEARADVEVQQALVIAAAVRVQRTQRNHIRRLRKKEKRRAAAASTVENDSVATASSTSAADDGDADDSSSIVGRQLAIGAPGSASPVTTDTAPCENLEEVVSVTLIDVLTQLGQAPLSVLIEPHVCSAARDCLAALAHADGGHAQRKARQRPHRATYCMQKLLEHTAIRRLTRAPRESLTRLAATLEAFRHQVDNATAEHT